MTPHLDDAKAQALVDCCLPDDERACCEEHAAACAGCGAMVESYRALADALGDLDRAVPPAGFTDDVMCCIDAADRGRAWNRRIAGAILATALAACAALVVLSGAGSWAGGIARAATWLGDASAAVRVTADVLAPVARAFQIEIVVTCSAIALAILFTIARLAPRHGEVVA